MVLKQKHIYIYIYIIRSQNKIRERQSWSEVKKLRYDNILRSLE